MRANLFRAQLPEADDLGQSILHLMRTYVSRRLKEVRGARAQLELVPEAQRPDDSEGARLDAEHLALVQLQATLSPGGRAS